MQASILIADEDTGVLRFRAAVGGRPERIKEMTIEAEARHFGLGCNASTRANRQRTRARRSPFESYFGRGWLPSQIASMRAAPMGRWVGVVQLLNKSGGRSPFGQDDLKLATVIAGHISTAIKQAQSRDREARQQRLSTLGRFLSSMLHDLKTPLTVIAGYTKLLVQEEIESKRQEFAETIEKQLQLLKAMTGETLAFAKGERKIWIRKVYLYKFFEELAEQLRTDLANRSVRLELGVARSRRRPLRSRKDATRVS